ncbi:hypothetical protein L484_000895 [Morus notabilis]|uniref:Uncharacterized protein n=1 Tax=Morus notabilis TaxID=981085 RepID=W9QU61_9ROSA|nr:hypothetical protein L484_000895 [Morus notabilis]
MVSPPGVGLGEDEAAIAAEIAGKEQTENEETRSEEVENEEIGKEGPRNEEIGNKGTENKETRREGLTDNEETVERSSRSSNITGTD